MTQGIYVNGERPKTKKALKEAIKNYNGKGATSIVLEATSIMENEYGGALIDAPNSRYYIVGPDPYKSRKWYANITKQGNKITIS